MLFTQTPEQRRLPTSPGASCGSVVISRFGSPQPSAGAIRPIFDPQASLSGRVGTVDAHQIVVLSGASCRWQPLKRSFNFSKL
eukprot:2602229-Amphidinium_carterae.1